MSHLQFMDQQRLHYHVQVLCKTLGVVPSRYYARRKGAVAGVVAPAEPAWETALVDVFDDHQRRYGTRRLRVELRELGHQVGRQAIRMATPPCAQSLAAQGVCAAHHRFHPRQTVRAELAARPA